MHFVRTVCIAAHPETMGFHVLFNRIDVFLQRTLKPPAAPGLGLAHVRSACGPTASFWLLIRSAVA